MFLYTLIGYFVIFLHSVNQSGAENKELYAPFCPSSVAWMPEYICKEGYVLTFGTELVNEVEERTICCSEQGSPKFSLERRIFEKPPQPDLCPANWPVYAGVEDISKLGVPASPLGMKESFVGQANMYGNVLPGKIVFDVLTNTYCFFFGTEYGNCVKDFQYLESANDYVWVSSENGRNVQNAIRVNSFLIGRIVINETLIVGKVDIDEGLFYIDEALDMMNYAKGNYEVLTSSTCLEKSQPSPEVKVNSIEMSADALIVTTMEPSTVLDSESEV